MNKFLSLFMTVALVAILVVASGAFYTVDETQQAVVTQFGKLVSQPKTEAGLYFKIPFIQRVNYFDKRILQWDGDANQMPTRDKRFIWVDTIARWRIADPLKFMQSVRTETSAQTRLDDIIDASTRDVISSHNLIEAIRSTNHILENKTDEFVKYGDQSGSELVRIKTGREELARKILERAQATMPSYGIQLIDVRIKRINYVKEVQGKVYERMISERKRAAERFRSEGQGKKAEIEGQMGKELNDIQSGAYRKAQEIKGKADAEAIKIYAEAYNKDPDFYSFLKTLEAYKTTVGPKTQLILSTNNDFYKQLTGIGNITKP